jgi:hypothetical protein
MTLQSRKAFLQSLGALALTAGVTQPRSATAADAQALLVACDGVRNPGQAFKVVVSLAEFEKGKQVDASVLNSYSRTLADTGQFASLIQFVQPLRDAGKLLLKSGSDLWFYDPSTKASVRIAPQQRLMGQAANGDVVTVNFSRDYRARLAAEESITDGDRQPRNSFKLELSAAAAEATYPAIELWIDSNNSAPIKARFLAESGRLLKSAFFRKFQRQLGADRPTETVIIDGINSGAVTIVRMSDFQAKALPMAWFQRDYLARFQAD